MCVAAPDFVEINNPQNPSELLAFCWYAAKGQEILGKTRPVGRIFAVEGESPRQKHRLAGLAYKLFGFTIGDRTLPQRTLWTTTLQRALWFTGEIHIVDKTITPTTDRSNFVENDSRARFYRAAEQIPRRLNREAQQISDDRKTHDDSQKLKRNLESYEKRLTLGQIESAELKSIKEDINESLDALRRRALKCKDQEILVYEKEILNLGKTIQTALKNPQVLKTTGNIGDIAAELKMSTKARKVFQIIMDTLASHYREEKDEYYRVAGKIFTSLRKKY